MYSLGYDIGSSFIKCSIIEIETGKLIAAGSYPDTEMTIDSPHPGWAEQHPDMWWQNVVVLTNKLLHDSKIESKNIKSIGISYQMHGLVCVDKNGKPLRPAIIWCDSRAVSIGEEGYKALGKEYCDNNLLNSPGNFTASKLRWVQQNEPDIYKSIFKIMLPGDYIAYKLTGDIVTTVSGLSEGIFYDFRSNTVSQKLLKVYNIREELLPPAFSTFSVQGAVTQEAAKETGLPAGIPVAYRAGDQPNNAFSLNVLNPGEIAATAGTSGVVYGVTDAILSDRFSRVNLFAHVNHSPQEPRLGVLLCINGTGISNSWLRKTAGANKTYDEINALAEKVPIGSQGVRIYPFGNGAERMLKNATIGAHIMNLDFNRHTFGHLARATHEGVAFSFKYGIEIMNEMGLNISVIRAGKANMFLSPVFRETLANITNAFIELYNTDGAQGAARGAALGAGFYRSPKDAFQSFAKVGEVSPSKEQEKANEAYSSWKEQFQIFLK
ncbi:MAG: carbohydrate kinase [Bacteroidetes bacterium]|nr:carbohydrate kinase [Bacteroidota bacterium]